MEMSPVHIKEIDKNAANIYEAVIVAARKARLLNDEQKQEYNSLVSTLISADDDFEEKENPDQLKISLELEKRPKPHLRALKSLLDSEVTYRYKDNA